MSGLSEFLSMGGYAFYVWTSFGAALVLIGGVALFAVSELARVRRETFRASLARAQRAPAARADAATARGGTA